MLIIIWPDKLINPYQGKSAWIIPYLLQVGELIDVSNQTQAFHQGLSDLA